VSTRPAGRAARGTGRGTLAALSALAGDLSLISVCIADEAGMLTYVNPTLTALLDYEPEDLLGEHFTTLVFPEHRQAAETAFEASKLTRGAARPTGTLLRTRTGERRYVLGEVRWLSGNDGWRQVLTAFVDITGEYVARRDASRLAAGVEAIPDAVVVFDEEGQISPGTVGPRTCMATRPARRSAKLPSS